MAHPIVQRDPPAPRPSPASERVGSYGEGLVQFAQKAVVSLREGRAYDNDGRQLLFAVEELPATTGPVPRGADPVIAA